MQLAILAQDMLQWVHGLITVVMFDSIADAEAVTKLQWVHGLITVVMRQCNRKFVQ